MISDTIFGFLIGIMVTPFVYLTIGLFRWGIRTDWMFHIRWNKDGFSFTITPPEAASA